MLGIVLSGGGSKGAYEIGVWKAFRKLKIKYNIVTGTSVGALNGAMMVQNDYRKALNVWKNINYDRIIDNSNLDNDKNFTKFYIKSFFKTGGATVSRLEELVDIAVDEKKFFKSSIDFGLVTYNYSKLKPVILTKKQITYNELNKYIIASSTCFPFFKKKKIDNEQYIDGGYYDNLPINLAISLGANEIIAVDLKAIGIKQKVKDENIKITYISPNNNIGNMLVFEKKIARTNIKYGYNDTMKIFNKLDGNKFTFKKGNLNKNYNKYNKKYFETMEFLFEDTKKVIKKCSKNSINNFNYILEELGILFSLDESKIYNIKKYNKLLKKKIKKIGDINNHNKIQKLTSIFDKEQIIKYIYKLMKSDINKNKKKLINYSLLMHDEVLMAIYLYTIK